MNTANRIVEVQNTNVDYGNARCRAEHHHYKTGSAVCVAVGA